MRVLHVIPAVAARYGGPSAAVVGLCTALEAAGIATQIATTDADGPGRLPVPLESATTWEGVPAIFFRRRMAESFKWSGRLKAWVGAHAREFDLLHVHAVFSHSSMAAGRAARAAGRPYVVRPLGALDPWSLQRHRWRKAAVMQMGARPLLANAAAVHYTTDEERELAERSYPWLPSGVVVPLGIAPEYFEDTVRKAVQPPYLLALSRLDVKKRLGDLITAFHALGPAVGEWRLVVAGEGDAVETARLRRLASDGAARDRIRFAGWVSGASKLELLRGATLFAVPSHQENFGLGLVEALACGVPAVVTPGVNLGASVVAAGAGWQLGPDAAGWPAALSSILTDRPGLEVRGRAARAFSRRFQWGVVASEMAACYRRIAGEATSASVSPDARRARVRHAGGGD